jgi:hypothetical protein
MHPEIEQLVHEQAMQYRSYKCRLKDGYAMKTYTGEIDKSRKQSASKINFIDLTANVIQSAKAVTRECVIRGWRKMESEAN